MHEADPRVLAAAPAVGRAVLSLWSCLGTSEGGGTVIATVPSCTNRTCRYPLSPLHVCWGNGVGVRHRTAPAEERRAPQGTLGLCYWPAPLGCTIDRSGPSFPSSLLATVHAVLLLTIHTSFNHALCGPSFVQAFGRGVKHVARVSFPGSQPPRSPLLHPLFLH